MTLPTTNWVGVTLPGGFYYLVDEDGNRITDEDGNYLVSEPTTGTTWTSEITAALRLLTDGGLVLVTDAGATLTTGTGLETDWTDE